MTLPRLNDELRIVIETHLASRDPVPPGDVSSLAERVTIYEGRVPTTSTVPADLKALVDQLSTFTKELVAVRQACGEALQQSRAAHTAAEQALARAESIASEVP